MRTAAFSPGTAGHTVTPDTSSPKATIASIHFAQGQDRDRVTRRAIAAMQSPYVHAIGHPSGRLLGRRDAMDLDWEKIFEAAAQTGTALELSAAWQRLDLKDLHVRQAIEAGCKICINTDAHGTEQLDQNRRRLDAGVGTEVEVLQSEADLANKREELLERVALMNDASDVLKTRLFPGKDVIYWSIEIDPIG